MSSLSVTVLTPHGRRQNVQVFPHMTLLKILEEVCKKYDFNSDEYCLKHHNKELDLTQMFRFSGLPNKCFLEMNECSKSKTREETDVVICIQLENGTRHQGQFQPNQTLKDVLQKLSPASFDGNPVIVYTRIEIYGDDLEKTTLKSLGITKGRAMFRILNKNPDDLKNQASVYVPSVKPTKTPTDENESGKKLKSDLNTKEDGKNNKSSGDKSKKNLGITTDKIRDLIPKKSEKEKNQKKDEPMEVDEEKITKESTSVPQKEKYDWGTSVGRSMNDRIVELTNEDQQEGNEEFVEEPEIFELGERNAVIFSLDTAQKVADDIPDSFFDLTIDDIKILLRDLRREASGNEDAPLLTAKLRELEDNKRTLTKLSQYKKSVIRIQFPDRMVLQGTFSLVDKIENVYNFVRNYLENPELKFHLFTTPPKKILNTDLTLVEADCVPAAVLHFGIDDTDKNQNEDGKQQKSFLKEGLQQTSATGAIIAASKSRGVFTNKQPQFSTEQFEEDQQCRPSTTHRSPDVSTGAVPKQLKSESSKKSSDEPGEKIPKWFKPFKK